MAISSCPVQGSILMGGRKENWTWSIREWSVSLVYMYKFSNVVKSLCIIWVPAIRSAAEGISLSDFRMPISNTICNSILRIAGYTMHILIACSVQNTAGFEIWQTHGRLIHHVFSSLCHIHCAIQMNFHQECVHMHFVDVWISCSYNPILNVQQYTTFNITMQSKYMT